MKQFNRKRNRPVRHHFRSHPANDMFHSRVRNMHAMGDYPVADFDSDFSTVGAAAAGTDFFSRADATLNKFMDTFVVNPNAAQTPVPIYNNGTPYYGQQNFNGSAFGPNVPQNYRTPQQAGISPMLIVGGAALIAAVLIFKKK